MEIIDQLREQRNEYTRKAQELQQKIDEIDLELHNMDQYLNQYVVIKAKHFTVYMYIKAVQRLYSGAVFTGDSFITTSDRFYINFEYDYEFTHYYKDAAYHSASEVTIITKEEYNKQIQSICDKILKDFVHE